MLTIQKADRVDPVTLSFKTIDFPAGEVGVRVDTQNHRFRADPRPTTITARIQNHRDFMELVMATSALQEWAGQPERLVLPCVPNARQDRVCSPGDAFGLLAFARQIAALGFKELVTFDPHSEVTPSVFKALGMKVKVIDQATIIGQFSLLNARLHSPPDSPTGRPLFCSPDAGANKKTSDLAALYSQPYFIRADKLRELSTGKIKECVVINPREEVEGRDVVVIDDIGDRCGTFIGLAKALKAKGAKSVELYITHGLFTAEIDSILNPLCEAGVSHIWTTNSYRTDLETLGKQNLITVLKLEDAFAL